ncbi:MAG TPA: GntR family transcriptional regulator [Nocardioidaceae bacterium]
MDELDVQAITVDHAAATPPFEQVRAHIAGLIASGRLPSGTKLPTVRRLATDLRLATNTAARAYRELEADGLVVTHGRRGTFVNSELTGAGADSDVAIRAREATAVFVKEVRALGLTRGEATQLVEQGWVEG